ncbi:MAG: radical SAM protein [Desulfurococcales archaeon]|nr:radical SAM protein [Desulfurococcales archaeon]
MAGIGIVYPGPRSVAYSSIAFHMLAGYMRESGVQVSKFYLEDGLVSMDGRGGVPGILMVSLPYELMYVDLVKMLMQMRINPYRSRRGRGDPLIIAGGPAVTANPAPILPLVDAVLVGEAEPALDHIVEASQSSRSRALEELASAPGMLIPGLTEAPVRRSYVEDLDKSWYPILQEVPGDVEPVWGRSFMLETSRGCARACRFCMEGSIFRPWRVRSTPRLRELLDAGLEYNRVGKVNFYSLAFFDHRNGDEILEYAVSRGVEVSIPSIRAETLTPERARLVAEGGQRTITIAPETGSCRIARAINKMICTGGAVEAVRNALEGGIRSIKLYIMVGIPGESREDLDETINMVVEASKILRGRGTLKLSINPFIPKPATPMQWLGLGDLKTLRTVIQELKALARRIGAQASSYDPRYAVVQTTLSRGDERLADVIIEWALRGGRLGSFKTAARAIGVDISQYTSPWSLDTVPVWHKLVEDPFNRLKSLRREYEIYLSITGGGMRINSRGSRAP